MRQTGAGIMFQDITTLLLDPKAFKDTIDLFVERYKGRNISVVAGKERRNYAPKALSFFIELDFTIKYQLQAPLFKALKPLLMALPFVLDVGPCLGVYIMYETFA